MAELTHEDVLKLAKLAHLRLTEDEAEEFQSKISSVLGYVEQLQNTDLSNESATDQVTKLTNVTREDIVENLETNKQDLLKNTPALEGELIKVKRMLN